MATDWRAEAHDDGDEVRPAPTLRWNAREACDSLAFLDADDAPPALSDPLPARSAYPFRSTTSSALPLPTRQKFSSERVPVNI